MDIQVLREMTADYAASLMKEQGVALNNVSDAVMHDLLYAVAGVYYDFAHTSGGEGNSALTKWISDAVNSLKDIEPYVI